MPNGTQFILNQSFALDFILAGNSLFTVVNTKTKERFTYKVKRDKKNRFIFYVRVYAGNNFFLYIGAVCGDVFVPKINPNALSVQVFKFILVRLEMNWFMPYTEIYHHNICGRCGAILTAPQSILDGLGPDCKQLLEKTRYVHPELFNAEKHEW